MESSNQATWKRLLKCGFSLGVYSGMRLARGCARVFGLTLKPTCVVLYYHSVPSHQRAEFARQLDTLLRRARPIPFSGEVVLTPGAHHVAVTFDDGFANYLEEAWPELHKRGIPSVVFVIADALGKGFGTVECSERLLSAEQLGSLPPDLVTLGSHTLTHPMLTRIPEEQAYREIAQSRQQLQSVFNREIRLFSFPFGDFNRKLVNMCKKAGYKHVFTTLPELGGGYSSQFVIGRVRVDPTDWPIEFRLKLAGAYRWLPFAFAVKRRLASAMWKLAAAAGWRRATPLSPASQSMIRQPGQS